MYGVLLLMVRNCCLRDRELKRSQAAYLEDVCTVLPGSTASRIASSRLDPNASGTGGGRILPILCLERAQR